MFASSLPTKFAIPFANNAAPANTNPIPQASQIGVTAGAASLVDGFPPLTFVPITAGGIPPWGRDFNGLLNQITAWVRYNDCAGGLPIYDASFATAIGGYPRGSLLSSTSLGGLWLSTIDNNTSNPDTTFGAAGAWVAVGFITQIQNEAYISSDDTGTPNNVTMTTSPPIAGYVKYQRFQCKIANTSTGSTVGSVTVNIQGLGAKNLVYADLSPPLPLMLTAGEIAMFVYDGVQFQLENTYPTLRIPIGSPIIYVRTDGNDNNSGLTNTPSGAMLTIQAALTRAQNVYQLQGKVATIQMGIPGTYIGGFLASGLSGSLIVQGDLSNQAGYIISGPGGNTNALIQVQGSQIFLQGCTVTNTQNKNSVATLAAGGVFLNKVTFKQSGSSNSFGVIAAQTGGAIQVTGPTTISASAGEALVATGGTITMSAVASVLTFSGGPIFSQATAFASNTGVIYWNQPSSNAGSATGPRYNATLNGVVATNTGSSPTFIPGDSSGTTSSGGQYD